MFGNNKEGYETMAQKRGRLRGEDNFIPQGLPHAKDREERLNETLAGRHIVDMAVWLSYRRNAVALSFCHLVRWMQGNLLLFGRCAGYKRGPGVTPSARYQTNECMLGPLD